MFNNFINHHDITLAIRMLASRNGIKKIFKAISGKEARVTKMWNEIDMAPPSNM